MSENPHESGKEPHSDAKPKSAVPFLVRLVIYGAIIAVLIALLLPAVRTARPAARRNACLNNMKQITLALLHYETAHGEFPPAYTVDAEGNRLHSWRALILPYLEGNTLHEHIDYTKPWDDPANAEARDTSLYEYLCPSSSGDDLRLTQYMAVVDPDGAFAGETPRKLDEFEGDGTSNTILLVEVSQDRAVHWMEPVDVSIDEIMADAPNGRFNHSHVFSAAYADGHADFIDVDIAPETLRAQLTIAGGEALEE